MNAPLFRSALFALCLIRGVAAEDSTPKPAHEANPSAPAKPATEEMIRARLLEHTKTKAAAKSAAQPASTTADKSPVAPATPPAVAAAPAAPEKMDPAKTRAEAAAVLPKVEVNKSRVTVLDHQLQEQDKEIAREKKLTKSTDLDRALNGPQTSVAILGGESTKYRTTMASERVSLMESEKDVMEAIAHAKTKEEKAELQKELIELKAMRRDLEKSVR